MDKTLQTLVNAASAAVAGLDTLASTSDGLQVALIGAAAAYGAEHLRGINDKAAINSALTVLVVEVRKAVPKLSDTLAQAIKNGARHHAIHGPALEAAREYVAKAKAMYDAADTDSRKKLDPNSRKLPVVLAKALSNEAHTVAGIGETFAKAKTKADEKAAKAITPEGLATTFGNMLALIAQHVVVPADDWRELVRMGATIGTYHPKVVPIRPEPVEVPKAEPAPQATMETMGIKMPDWLATMPAGAARDGAMAAFIIANKPAETKVRRNNTRASKG